MLTQAPKGTRDVLPGEAYLWQYVENKMRTLAALWGYREVRTPVFEHTELFLRGVGGTTDIVQKEMYTFLDKGERSITLKPEGTAGAVRAFVEAGLSSSPMPIKMYYINIPIFRYEAPQAGRYREHHQFGMECIGGREPTVEAELITLLIELLSDIGLKNLSVHINSIGCENCRPRYHEALKTFVGARIENMCEDCKARFDKNPLRVLDCKQEKCQALLKNAPSILDCLCPECLAHFEKLKALLTAQGIPFKVDSRIVRGLDYYTKTVFEIIMQSGRGDLALCGGGRYDGLVAQLGGAETPAAGFGIGTERILMEMKNAGVEPPVPATMDIYVANLGADMALPAFTLTQALRKLGVKADLDMAGRSLKAQFKYADKMGAKFIAIVGGDEYARGTLRVRDMQSKQERELPLSDAAQAILSMVK